MDAVTVDKKQILCLFTYLLLVASCDPVVYRDEINPTVIRYK